MLLPNKTNQSRTNYVPPVKLIQGQTLDLKLTTLPKQKYKENN
jgi:hypothetical protein